MASVTNSPRVVVVLGLGGMGLPIARRLAAGRRLVIADYSSEVIKSAPVQLLTDGYQVNGHVADVAERDLAVALARAAAALGSLASIVHTAGLSGTGTTSVPIYDVNLLDTADAIDASRSPL